MKKSLSVLFSMCAVLVIASSSGAGGKRDGEKCHVSRSCRSNYCVTLNPADKFGVCCSPQDCPELSAQCGEIDNGCGVPVQCGSCSPGSACTSNQCVPATTTTSSTTTTTMCAEVKCGANPLCGQGTPGSCFEVQAPETGACTPVCASNADCQSLTSCTATSDCGPGEVCAIKTCCGAGGLCFATCPEPTTTTSTTTTSTTIPGP